MLSSRIKMGVCSAKSALRPIKATASPRRVQVTTALNFPCELWSLDRLLWAFSGFGRAYSIPILCCYCMYCIVLYCIVLHLVIYKAILSASAFQKRFQCEQLWKKRQDFSFEKDERLPERMAEQTGGEVFYCKKVITIFITISYNFTNHYTCRPIFAVFFHSLI